MAARTCAVRQIGFLQIEPKSLLWLEAFVSQTVSSQTSILAREDF